MAHEDSAKQHPRAVSQNSLPPETISSSLPHISYHQSQPGGPDERCLRSDDNDDEPLIAKCFDRSTSPHTASPRNSPSRPEKAGHDKAWGMHKVSLYETASRFYLIGADALDRRFRILKIDRTAESGDLSVAADDIVYTKKETNHLLNAVDDGNRSSGGLKLKSSSWGLLGFIKFTGEYYMLLITKRSQVAIIGGHSVYQVDGTELVSLTASSARPRSDRYPEEDRFVGILNNLDLSRAFYFSYSYDITNTLQRNIHRERDTLLRGQSLHPIMKHNEMFVWNHHLLKPAKEVLKNPYDWCLSIVHGFVDQARLFIYGRTVYITIIARRSRYFAGARYLKRGANDLGFVANDVETEQIVSEMLTTSFHAAGPRLYASPNYTSYVQHRGSIPLFWTQDNNGVNPKPDIKINLVDPFYSAAAMHFSNLFERYGAPVFVLNLVKARERTPRESILLKEFTNAIKYLNQSLPSDKNIIYKAWDMSRASKSRDQDVIGTLEGIAEDVLKVTGFFHNGDGEESPVKMQNGITRTNCIDCLDRTNAAQFVIGKLALGHQLYALGVLSGTSIEYDTDAVNLFHQMYHRHGDNIAIQYGGSHLVNTMETYRKINQWTSHSRDMVESFKRYYNNSFLDGQRQEAYNLFLGNYTFAQGHPMLWDLSTDYYLHHADPKAWSVQEQRNYIKWYDPNDLQQRKMAPTPKASHKMPDYIDDYWLEYYRPLAVSSFLKMFSFRIDSNLDYAPFKSAQEGKYDLSPFRIRVQAEPDIPEKQRDRKGVTILDPRQRERNGPCVPDSTILVEKSLPNWLQAQYHDSIPVQLSILKESNSNIASGLKISPGTPGTSKTLKDRSTQWTLSEFVIKSLNPSVTASEMEEYGRYISHPLNLPLVALSDMPPAPSLEFHSYFHSTSAEAISSIHTADDDIAEYTEFLDVGDDPLTVSEADTPKKRYKAYRQWLKGKSLFKQSRIEH